MSDHFKARYNKERISNQRYITAPSKSIKEYALNHQETIYKMEVMDDAIVNFLLLKHKEETIAEVCFQI